ncbi:MAG: hypothetical protein WB789_01095 [Thermoplasmata archaeon]
MGLRLRPATAITVLVVGVLVATFVLVSAPRGSSVAVGPIVNFAVMAIVATVVGTAAALLAVVSGWPRLAAQPEASPTPESSPINPSTGDPELSLKSDS